MFLIESFHGCYDKNFCSPSQTLKLAQTDSNQLSYNTGE